MKSQLQSVSESHEHGILSLNRNARQVFILVDGDAAFKDHYGAESAMFRLTPGLHELRWIFLNFNLYTRERQAEVVIEPNKTTKVYFTIEGNVLKYRQDKPE
jgi:hypothetical protein